MSYVCCIYKIINTLNNKVYIGSTRRSLSRRLSNHKYCARNNLQSRQSKFYKYMREIGIDKFSIVALEHKRVQNKEEQYKLEREHQDATDNKLNTLRAIVTYEETLESGREWIYNNHDHKRQQDRDRDKKIIEDRKFTCDVCNYNSSRIGKLNDHLATKMHKLKISE